MKNCCVIMSSYNGEKYISHQLDTIINQSDVTVDIFVRDDGSNDRTVSIVEQYCQKCNNVHLIKGINVGVIESFRVCSAYVLENKKRYDYYCFADQDDEWLPQKLLSAIKKIEESNKDELLPILYYSNLKVSDNNLNYLYDRFDKNYVLNTKKQILSEICVLGCTCVFNEKLLKEYVRTNLNHRIPHDAWIAVLATFLGNIIYDENVYILYRQHGNNQSGSIKKGVSMYWNKLNRFKHLFDMDGDYEAIAREMINNYENRLNESDKEMLKTIADYRINLKYRFKLLFTGYISSGHIWKEASRRIRIICNRL